MKPTHTLRKSGEPVCFINIRLMIEPDTIKMAVMKLIEDNEEPITKKKVTEYLRTNLKQSGWEFFHGCGVLDYDNWSTDDMDALHEKAATISKKLFPKFFNQVKP